MTVLNQVWQCAFGAVVVVSCCRLLLSRCEKRLSFHMEHLASVLELTLPAIEFCVLVSMSCTKICYLFALTFWFCNASATHTSHMLMHSYIPLHYRHRHSHLMLIFYKLFIFVKLAVPLPLLLWPVSLSWPRVPTNPFLHTCLLSKVTVSLYWNFVRQKEREERGTSSRMREKQQKCKLIRKSKIIHVASKYMFT